MTGTGIDQFFDGKRYAMVGTDPSTPYGTSVMKALETGGRQAYAVFTGPADATATNAEAETETYGSLQEIGEPLDGVIFNVEHDPQRMLREVQAAVAQGVPRIWIENRCEAAEAVAYAREHGVEVVDNACPLLVLDPRHVHWLHRKVLDVFGKTPRVQHAAPAA